MKKVTAGYVEPPCTDVCNNIAQGCFEQNLWYQFWGQ